MLAAFISIFQVIENAKRRADGEIKNNYFDEIHRIAKLAKSVPRICRKRGIKRHCNKFNVSKGKGDISLEQINPEKRLTKLQSAKVSNCELQFAKNNMPRLIAKKNLTIRPTFTWHSDCVK